MGAHFAYVHAQQVRRKFVHALAAAGIFVWLAVIESQRVSAIFTDVVMIVWAVIFAAVVLASIHEWRLRLRLNKSHGAAEPNGCH
ncbi:MAG: hypothetical protein HYR85_21655 [Planctomycetes bacterium]|nr:hypothetical protein [Planctomycetota bacterium]MBI3848598.1 hypothetical protein [Planctomycetota bacterium]